MKITEDIMAACDEISLQANTFIMDKIKKLVKKKKLEPNMTAFLCLAMLNSRFSFLSASTITIDGKPATSEKVADILNEMTKQAIKDIRYQLMDKEKKGELQRCH